MGTREVVFFPTSAHLDEASHEWIVPIHGSIYEPEPDSHKRAVVVTSLSRAVGVEAGTPESQRFVRCKNASQMSFTEVAQPTCCADSQSTCAETAPRPPGRSY